MEKQVQYIVRESQRALIMRYRSLLLALLDVMERDLNITPRTSQIRGWYKKCYRKTDEQDVIHIVTGAG